MRVSSHLALWLVILASLMVIGFVVPLQLLRANVSAGDWEVDSAIDAAVIGSASPLVTVSPPRKTPNYLESFNYSFETTGGWHVGQQQEGCIFFQPPLLPYHGQRSAQTVGGERGHSCTWWSPLRHLGELSLVAGHHYYFSGQIRTVGFERDTRAYISLVFTGPASYYNEFDSTVVTTDTVGSGENSDWVEVSTVVKVPPQADQVRVECRLEGRGQVWFDYLFLGLDIVPHLSKVVYPEQIAPGDSVTYTITYSNTGKEPAQDVEIREYLFLDPDVRFVTATPEADNPPDEWEVGELTTTARSIVTVFQVDLATRKSFLTNLVGMRSTNHVAEAVKMTLFASTTVTITSVPTYAVSILPPPSDKPAYSPDRVPLSHQVHNCGGTTTSITVTVSVTPTWAVTPSVTVVRDLPPGQIEQIAVEVTIPPKVRANIEGNVIWTATASGGNTSHSITDIIRIVGPPPSFVPMVAKEYREQLHLDLCPDPTGSPCNGEGTDPEEPNNVYCSTQTLLASGVSVQAPMCPGDPDDPGRPGDRDDYFYMDIWTAGTLDIWLKNLKGDYDLYLYNAGCCNMEYFDCTGEVAKSDGYGLVDEHVVYPVPADKLGRYYVRVYSTGQRSWDPYTLCATFSLANE